MAVYLILDFLILISLFAFKDKKKICILFLFVFIFLSAFRATSVGSDYLVYLHQYEESVQGTFWDCLFGDYFFFKIYCRFLNLLKFDFRGFIIVTSFFIGFLFWLSARKTENPLLTLFIYFSLGLYLQTFCIIRQSIAILIVMYGFTFLKDFTKKNIFVFYALNLCAIGFHIVSIATLIIPLLYFIFSKLSPGKIKYLIFGFIGFALLFIIFNYTYSYILPFFSDKYTRLYSESGSRAFGGNIVGGFLYLILYLVIYCVYCLKYNSLTDARKKIIGIYFILAFAFTAFSFISDDLGRLNLFIESNLVLITSELLVDDYNKRGNILSMMLLFFMAYLVLYLIRDSIGVVPYTFGM